MKLNLANLSGGPGILSFGDAAIYTQDGINLNPNLETFEVNVDGFEKVDERVSDTPLEFTATPAGVWGQFAKLYPYFNWPLGSYITPKIDFRSTAINIADDEIDLSTTFLFGLATGEKVYVGSRGALPGGLGADTVYYVKNTAGIITLHDTAAHAVAGTNKVDITSLGADRHSLVVERSIILHTFAGKKITFFNGAITKPGDIVCAAEKTLFEAFTFRAFQRNRTERTDAGSRFLVEDVPFADTSFNPDAILTQSYEVKWGDTSPWSLMDTQEGVKVSFPHQMSDVKFDGKGVATMKLNGVQAEATFKPLGIDEEDVFAKLGIQGAGAALGRSLKTGGANLDISGTGVFIRLFGANLKQAPLLFNQKDERAGDLQFVAARTFTGGVANPVAFVGEAQPA